MDKETKGVIMECESTDSERRTLATDIICYVNGERKKWKTACIIMSVVELLTIAAFIIILK